MRGEGYVLILTPLKNASRFLETYFSALSKLSYPRGLISLGFLESDSRDDTYGRHRLPGGRRGEAAGHREGHRPPALHHQAR